MEIKPELEYLNIEGQSLNINKDKGITNASFLFLSNGCKKTLHLKGIDDVVDLSHLIEAKDFYIVAKKKGINGFILSLCHQYVVEINIEEYSVNS